jgi:hypothetical protein
VSVDLDACAGIERGEIERVLAAELRVQPVAEAAGDPDLTRLRVRCGGEGTATLRLVDPTTGKEVSRRIAIAHLPSAARLLGLAAAELLSASWVELETQPVPTAPSPDRTASRSVRDRAHAAVTRQLGWQRTHPFRLKTGASVRGYGPDELLVFGADLVFSHDIAPHIGWSAEVGIEQGTESVALGAVEATLLSGTLSVLAFIERSWVRFEGAVGARLGWARLGGDADGREDVLTGSVRGAWGGPVLALRASIHLFERGIVTLGGEAGWATLDVAGLVEGGPDVALGGPWVAGVLRFGLRL